MHEELDRREAKGADYKPPLREEYSSLAGRATVFRSREGAPDTLVEVAFIGEALQLVMPPGDREEWELRPEQVVVLQVIST